MGVEPGFGKWAQLIQFTLGADFLFKITQFSKCASLVALMVKNLRAMQEETQVHDLDLEDPLEKEMGTHSSILT